MEPKNPDKDALVLKRGALGALVDFQLQVEKALTALKIRDTHLDKNGTPDLETKKLLNATAVFKKEFILEPVAMHLAKHPAYPWFSRVKGIGNENIAKVVTFIDIERAPTISSLWKYAGYAVVEGIAERLKKGEESHFNMTLKSMCYRVGVALLKAHAISKTGTKFGHFYEKAYAEEVRKAEGAGKKIALMDDIPKGEEEYYMNKLHVHNRAVRKMIKLFLACLWMYWREAKGLPTRAPYAIEKLDHTTIISPEEMLDRPKKKEVKTRKKAA